MTINRPAFWSLFRSAFPGPNSQAVVDGLEFLLARFEVDPRFADIRWIAYALATIRHETAGTFQPITERGARDYFNKYEPGTPIGRQLGNVRRGDGWLYRGRGYVQITGRNNYRKFQLENDPELALRPDRAYDVMARGMVEGMFTGKNLHDYLNAKKTDWTGARRIINGTDRAELIAGYAQKFVEILAGSLEPCSTEVREFMSGEVEGT